jgi:hypothetical protein
MVFYPENAPHEGRPLMDEAGRLARRDAADVGSIRRPGRRQIPVVTVFPAVSPGARTPGAIRTPLAHDVETYGLISYARQDRPIHIESLFLDKQT